MKEDWIDDVPPQEHSDQGPVKKRLVLPEHPLHHQRHEQLRYCLLPEAPNRDSDQHHG
ncbi:hypothetical protein AXX17_AT2G04330 [Arabidopsis thaliana]|uniref:Uncharacterized protein n=1 Tax=Arabidopsis thaliana TaxID=3702 RepID=A0A178VWG6_ARATH|nr:hypothetical protein AXX17_AT2G04330 [Arabidopsis thaliana]